METTFSEASSETEAAQIMYKKKFERIQSLNTTHTHNFLNCHFNNVLLSSWVSSKVIKATAMCPTAVFMANVGRITSNLLTLQ